MCIIYLYVDQNGIGEIKQLLISYIHWGNNDRLQMQWNIFLIIQLNVRQRESEPLPDRGTLFCLANLEEITFLTVIIKFYIFRPNFILIRRNFELVLKK